MSPKSIDSSPEGPSLAGASWAEGLSKGVFVHKKTKRKGKIGDSNDKDKKGKSPKKRVRGHKDKIVQKEDYLKECFESRSNICVSGRVDSHDAILSEASSLVTSLQSSMYSSVFTSLVQFVGDTSRGGDGTSRGDSAIPTAALMTGVNMPDHDSVFALLVEKLGGVTKHISLLGSGLSLRQMVTKMVVDLIGEDEEVKKTDASLSFLSDWYNKKSSSTTPKKGPSPSKKRKMSTLEQPPLVVIFQDFENCAGAALQDLIVLLSETSLPIVLVLGVATTLTTVHRALPQSVTARLTIHTFGSPNALAHLDLVVEKVIINSEIPFKLSSKVFQFLVETFLFHDFAVSHFMEGYKFILGEHFYRTPAAVLCCSFPEAVSRLNAMTSSELDSVRRLPSFRDYVETLAIERQAELLVNDAECTKLVEELLDQFHEGIETYNTLVRILHHLGKDLPRRPLGRSLRDVYGQALGDKLLESVQFKEALQFLKLTSRTDLEKKIELVLGEVDKLGQESDLSSLGEQLKAAQVKLTMLGNVDSVPASPAVGTPSTSMPGTPMLGTPMGILTPSDSCTNTPTISSKNSTPMLGKLDRYQLQASLLEAARDKNRFRTNPYDMVRTEVINALHEALKQHLKSPTYRPLHEILVFSATPVIRRHLVGAPRAALHTALTDPYQYLEDDQLKIKDPGEIPSTLPDVSIGYKLHLECPRLINVFDWLTCWHSILTQAAEEDISEQHQARFTVVIQELQTLGFIKTSRRKTDHVARLTFGGS